MLCGKTELGEAERQHIEVRGGYHAISSSSRSSWTATVKTRVGMLALAQVARSLICPYRAAGSVKNEVRIATALCWKPIGMEGSSGPAKAVAHASHMSVASLRGVSWAIICRSTFWSSIGGVRRCSSVSGSKRDHSGVTSMRAWL